MARDDGGCRSWKAPTFWGRRSRARGVGGRRWARLRWGLSYRRGWVRGAAAAVDDRGEWSGRSGACLAIGLICVFSRGRSWILPTAGGTCHGAWIGPRRCVVRSSNVQVGRRVERERSGHQPACLPQSTRARVALSLTQLGRALSPIQIRVACLAAPADILFHRQNPAKWSCRSPTALSIVPSRTLLDTAARTRPAAPGTTSLCPRLISPVHPRPRPFATTLPHTARPNTYTAMSSSPCSKQVGGRHSSLVPVRVRGIAATS